MKTLDRLTLADLRALGGRLLKKKWFHDRELTKIQTRWADVKAEMERREGTKCQK